MKTRSLLALLALMAVGNMASAQLKQRADAFPPVADALETKEVTMASSPEEMTSWDRYPTYETYVEMMQHWVERYPGLCRLDTIGTSVQGRLILSMEIASDLADTVRPQFFYSSTIHGDEVTGYVMMLRLIDTLLSGYGTNPQYTALVNSTLICINPLANPDGTYHGGNHTVQGSQRYNADNLDLNRLYPDPFNAPVKALPQENQVMIDYLSRHHFRLSANLHGGAEVMNYPWDSFTSASRPHPDADWWMGVCKRFVDTSHTYNSNHFRDVTQQGYIAGGDWYVISGGRQDYVNYYHDCLEVTMEISSTKTVRSSSLPSYWQFLQHSLVNYIEEIHNLPNASSSVADAELISSSLSAFPNPVQGNVTVTGLNDAIPSVLYDLKGMPILSTTSVGGILNLDLGLLPQGVYLLRNGGRSIKLVRR